jgi:hypothetical protein
MNDRVKMDPSAPPSLKDLHKASVAAILVVAIVLVVAVLPAELGVDPTGLGTRLGLTALGELKQGSPPAVTPAEVPSAPGSEGPRADEVTLTLKPGESTEVKAIMGAGAVLSYSWNADGGKLFYDFHGEPAGAAPDVFTSFEKGTRGAASGDFEAPFDGVHGWYWKNVGPEPVHLRLKTRGVYSKISRLR